MPRRLIINADDFGWDDAASEAILELAAQKSITSTTIMANRVKKYHLEELKKIKSISAGIHLNLIDGKPLSPPEKVKSLINKNGDFFSSSELFTKYLSGKIKKEDIITETKAQIEYLRASGIEVSHADSHQHVHVYPFIGTTILTAFQQTGIKKIRRVNIPDFWDKRRLILKAFYLLSSNRISHFQSPANLLSDFSIAQKANDSIFEKSLLKVTTISEMMTHPGTLPRAGSYLNRVSEYTYLKNKTWMPLLEKNKIDLITYNDL